MAIRLVIQTERITITVERIRRALLAGAGRGGASTRHDVLARRDRDAVMVSLLAYAGLRSQEMRGLC